VRTEIRNPDGLTAKDCTPKECDSCNEWVPELDEDDNCAECAEEEES
jgi:hypothetical protein